MSCGRIRVITQSGFSTCPTKSTRVITAEEKAEVDNTSLSIICGLLEASQQNLFLAPQAIKHIKQRYHILLGAQCHRASQVPTLGLTAKITSLDWATLALNQWLEAALALNWEYSWSQFCLCQAPLIAHPLAQGNCHWATHSRLSPPTAPQWLLTNDQSTVTHDQSP